MSGFRVRVLGLREFRVEGSGFREIFGYSTSAACPSPKKVNLLNMMVGLCNYAPKDVIPSPCKNKHLEAHG